MSLRFDTSLLSHLSDGVILLDRLAQVRGHNEVAVPWVPRCRAMLGVLKVMIDEDVHGRVTLPIRINLWANSKTGDRPASAWLLQDGQQNYAVFIPSQQGTTQPAQKQRVPSSRKSFIADKGNFCHEYQY